MRNYADITGLCEYQTIYCSVFQEFLKTMNCRTLFLTNYCINSLNISKYFGDQQRFSGKGEIVNILGFASLNGLCCSYSSLSLRSESSHRQVNECDCVPIKLYGH